MKIPINKQASCNIIRLLNHTSQKLASGKRVSIRNIERELGCKLEDALYATVHPKSKMLYKTEMKVNCVLRIYKDVIWETVRGNNPELPRSGVNN